MHHGQLVSAKLDGGDLGSVPPPRNPYPSTPPSLSAVSISRQPPAEAAKPAPPSTPKPARVSSDSVEHVGYFSLFAGCCAWTTERAKCSVSDPGVGSKGDRNVQLSEVTFTQSESDLSTMRLSRQYSEITESEVKLDDLACVYTSRFALACVAVVLLWSTTLSSVRTALGSSQAIRNPPVKVVVRETGIFFNETVRLHDHYIDCVRDGASQCNETLHYEFEKERDRAQQAKEHNVRVRSRSLHTQTACSNARALAIAAMNAWAKEASAGGKVAPDRYLPSCTAHQRETLQTLAQDSSQQKSATVLLAKNYSNASQSTVSRLAQQILARASYDVQYIDNKSHASAAYNRLVAALANQSLGRINVRLFSLNASRLFAVADSVEQLMRNAQARVSDQVLIAQYAYDQMRERASRFAAEATNKLSSAVHTLGAIANFINDNLPELGGISGMTGVPFPGFSFFEVEGPSLTAHLPSIDLELALPSVVRTAVRQVAQRLDETLDQTRQYALLEPGLLNAHIELATPGRPFADYNPPSIDALSIRNQHASESRHFEQNIIAQLDAFELASSRNSTSSLYDAYYANSTNNVLSRFTDTTWFTYKGLEDLGINLESLLAHAASVAAFLSSLDLIWRAMRTVNIVSRFWGRSALFVPPIDMETDADAKRRCECLPFLLFAPFSGAASFTNTTALLAIVVACKLTVFVLTLTSAIPHCTLSSSTTTRAQLVWNLWNRGIQTYTIMQKYALVVTNPWCIIAVVAVHFYLVASIAWALYEPVLASYRAGCTKTVVFNGQVVAAGQGTSLTRNAYALAFNYATSDGNRDRVNALDQHEERRSDLCSRYGGQSAQDQHTAEEDMNWIIQAHAHVAPDVLLMRSCYNLEALDASFAIQQPKDVNGNNFLLMSEILAEPACDIVISNSSLEDETFHCSTLSECTIGCDTLADENGVDQVCETGEIDDKNYETRCPACFRPLVIFERHFYNPLVQSNLLDFATSAACTAEWFAHAHVLNFVFTIAIYFFINFSRIILMGGLTRVSWQFLNTGYFSYHATCNRSGQSTHEAEDLGEKVETMLSTMRWKGIAMTCFAILIQIPWILALSFCADGLTYSSASANSLLG